MSDHTPLLEVLECGLTVDIDGATWPTVVVDASPHRQIADLPRLFVAAGGGEIETSATRIEVPGRGELLLLGVVMSAPVSARFALSFDLRRDRPTLLDAAGHGHLAISFGPPDLGDLLAVELEGDALREVVRPR